MQDALINIYGFSSVGRALVSKTRCREFESLNPCKEIKTGFGFLDVSIKTYLIKSAQYESSVYKY